MSVVATGFGSMLFGGGAYGISVDAPPEGFGAHDFGDDPYGVEAGLGGALGEPLTENVFLLAEDNALKATLGGIVVSDGNNNARRVGVWFNQPDPEIRSQNYPYILIDLIDVIENRAQVHSSYGPLDDGSADYIPSLPAYDPVNYGIGQYYLSPMLLVYQISAWSRHPRHDRSIISQLTHTVLHPRFAQLTVPTDGTARRVIVTSFVKRDLMDKQGKRVFRNIWTVQIPSEVFYDPVDLTTRAQAVIMNDETLIRNPPSTVNAVVYPQG